jgi:hypothetical protein
MNTGMTQLHNAREERRTEAAGQSQQASKQTCVMNENEDDTAAQCK